MGKDQGERSAGQGRRDEPEGELRVGGQRVTLRGRALRLILWLAWHQGRVNAVAPESGQLWMSWKGEGESSITGDIRTGL